MNELIDTVSTVAGVRQSKFRHLKGTPLHKNFHFENIRNLSMSMPGESDAFAINPTLIAVPLAGSGGLISVLQVRDMRLSITLRISGI